MIILGIETATMTGGVALIDDKRLISEYTLNVKTTHTARLMPALDLILRDSKIDKKQLEGIAVSIGPGSFTGLRIGLATAKGLAIGLDVPMAGIPTLEALASNIPFPEYQVCPVLDAKKKEVYATIYQHVDDKLVKKIPYQVMPPSTLVNHIKEKTIFLGDALDAYRDFFTRELGKLALFAPDAQRLPRAAVIAELGLARLKSGDYMDIVTSEPIYIRPSDAELSIRKE
ncbi:tRNA (adenosine(37)-N6)-threonylcarbamoyltransferase complex dimerization subunit type 1 TsaB [Candidatus Poribacteria bacterium]|nr:tRNA (adenosine(37)-N6)-threonylcarbamoyltransferase complex dimerization subunit type 1 TsaB [Candidatus Poribacteria bacterium]